MLVVRRNAIADTTHNKPLGAYRQKELEAGPILRACEDFGHRALTASAQKASGDLQSRCVRATRMHSAAVHTHGTIPSYISVVLVCLPPVVL